MSLKDRNISKVRHQTVILLKDGREWYTDEEWCWKSEADRHGQAIWKANMDTVDDWYISTYRA